MKRGMASGPYGNIVFITDAGNTWNCPSSLLTQRQEVQSFYFLDNKNGRALLNGESSDNQGMLLKTTNGGNTWGKMQSPPGRFYMSVFFLDKIFWVMK